MEKREGFIVNLISVFLFLVFVTVVVVKTLPFLERKYLYPLKYKEEVLSCCQEYGLNPYLIFSVIKTESSFNEKAVSDKGAKGLMQITDSTAKYIAKLMGVREYDIYSPKTNIRFGCYYIKILRDRFMIEETALCAYNAGEGNVSKWLKNKEYSLDGVNLSLVPYKETEQYIKKIYKSSAKYEKLYENIVDKTKNIE